MDGQDIQDLFYPMFTLFIAYSWINASVSIQVDE